LLRILVLAGRFLLVTPCIIACHRASMCCGVHGRIDDGVRAGRAVGDIVGFPQTATDGGRAVPVPASHAALSRALALRRGWGGWRLPGVYHEGGGGLAFRHAARTAPGGRMCGTTRGAGAPAAQGQDGCAGWPARPRCGTWRHGMRRGRSGPLWPVPHRASSGWRGRIRVLAGLPERVTPICLRTLFVSARARMVCT